MTPLRLASGVRVSALLRAAQAEGGFGAVLAKGDPTAGAILLLLRERGGEPVLYERVMAQAGDYEWQPRGGANAVDEAVAKARQRDPDLWVVELDIADVAHFVDETLQTN